MHLKRRKLGSFIGTRVSSILEIIISKNYGLLYDPATSVDIEDNTLLAISKEWGRDKIKKYSE